MTSASQVDRAAAARPAASPGGERRSLAGMAGFVLLLHVVGWGVLVFAVAPHDYRLGGTGVFGVGLGLTAYLLGVRHAFDADHIASIDNTTRKLVGEGRPSVAPGFWFSLGHSTVVFAPACCSSPACARSPTRAGRGLRSWRRRSAWSARSSPARSSC